MENVQPMTVSPAIEQTVYDRIVNQVFVIEDVTVGKGQNDYLVRYRGHLRSEDSIAAYDQVSKAFEPYNITPLFRKEEGRQAVILVPALPKPKASNPWINVLMFFLTVLSVAFVGGISSPLPSNPSGTLETVIAIFVNGLPFALALMVILVSHEFGHYLVGRWHGVHVSLPYFIPFPLPPFGTMGAFINMKERPKNRRYLLDIGMAGPLAGVIVAIPVIIIGLMLSQVGQLPAFAPRGGMQLTMEGNSLLYLFLKFIVFGKWLAAPQSFANISPIAYWVQFFFTGRPFPWGGLDVNLHPVAFAGWGGLLVTSLNLIPAGQFDGGHAMYVLFGKKVMQRMLPVILVALVVLGFFWPGWWLWAALIFFLGRVYAEPLDQITELDPKRRALAIFMIILFILVFTPVPLTAFGV